MPRQIKKQKSVPEAQASSAPVVVWDGSALPHSREINRLQARLLPESYSAETQVISAVISAGADVRRYDWYTDREYIERISAAHVDLSRMNGPNGVSVLNSHNQRSLDDVIGRTVPGTARIEGNEVLCDIRLSRRESLAELVADINDRIIVDISIGYDVTEYVDVTPPDAPRDALRIYEAQPAIIMEVSFVAVPADAGAGIRSADTAANAVPVRRQRNDAPHAAPAAKQKRKPEMLTVKQVRARAAAAGLSAIAIDRLARQHESNAFTEETLAAAFEAAQDPEYEENDDDAADGTQTENDFAASGATADTLTSAATSAARSLTPLQVRSAAVRAGLPVEDQDILVGTHARNPFTTQSLDSAIHARLSADQPNIVGRIHVGRDEGDTIRQRFAAGMAASMRNASPSAFPAMARQFQGYSLTDYIRGLADQVVGRRASQMGKSELVEFALTHRAGNHTTSDFAGLMSSAVNTVLQASYTETPQTYLQWCGPMSFMDFRVHNLIMMSEAPMTEELPESGEVKAVTVGVSMETARAKTYALRLDVSRELLINDNLGAIGNLVNNIGAGARRREEQLVYDQLIKNPSLKTDNQKLFSSDHQNILGTPGPNVEPFYLLPAPGPSSPIVAGHLNGREGVELATDTPFNYLGFSWRLVHDFGVGVKDYRGSGVNFDSITESSLEALEILMSEQKGIDGKTDIDVEPSVLLVGPKNKNAARRIVGAQYTVENGIGTDYNPYGQSFTVVFSKRIKAGQPA